MGVRDLQALAAEAKELPTYEPSLPIAAVEPALAKRIQAVRWTVVNNTDTNSHAANTVAVINDLERALQERTTEFDKMRRNYGGLHSICEEYNQQLHELREQLASGGQPEEMKRLKLEALKIPELESRLREMRELLKDNDDQLAAAKNQLAGATASLQEASTEKKKLQQLMRAGQAAALNGGEQLKMAQLAQQALQQEVQQANQAARQAAASRERLEAEAAQARVRPASDPNPTGIGLEPGFAAHASARRRRAAATRVRAGAAPASRSWRPAGSNGV